MKAINSPAIGLAHRMWRLHAASIHDYGRDHANRIVRSYRNGIMRCYATCRGLNVRFAFSAVAGTSGLLLLGLAFYGQPSLYLRQAQEEWNRIIGNVPADPVTADPQASPDRDVVAEQMTALQQQVAQLKDELAARQNAASQAAASAPPQPTPPQPLPPQPGSLQAGPTQPAPLPDRSTLSGLSESTGAPPAMASLAPPVASMPVPPVVQSLADASSAPPVANPGPRNDARKPDWLPPPAASGMLNEPMPSAIIVPQRREPVTAQPLAGRTELPKSDVARSDQARPDAGKSDPGRLEPGRMEAGKAATPGKPDAVRADNPRPDTTRSDPAKPDTGKSDPGRVEVARLEAGKVDPGRSDPNKPAPPKSAAAKPAPPPPPLPVAPRQEVDDTQSVLARLRQIAPSTVQRPEPPSPAESRPPEPKAAPASSPSLPKLNAARTALASGRIDDARRLLQEAQLQLVFRPVNISGDEQPLAGRSAADVAHALEALSANNISLSRRYIDTAVDDLTGNGTAASAQASELRSTGYAPAYPPR
jgi:hypothetical protein